jgi:hypothetical protein
VEAQAALVERQLEVLQHPPDLRLGIAQEVFMDHAMDAPGRGAVEVMHQRDVVR